MSEIRTTTPDHIPQPDPEQAAVLEKFVWSKELIHLTTRVLDTVRLGDPVAVAKLHQEQTGLVNPNNAAPNQLRIASAGVIPERGDSAYRHVNEAALNDLAESGIVRGAKIAGAPSKTSGHTVYWNRGEDSKTSTLGQGYVLEAPLDIVDNAWVTADHVTGIYAKDLDGNVKNALEIMRDQDK